MLNVDGWTDGRTNERTNGRKLARLCLPAKAGATKNVRFSQILSIFSLSDQCSNNYFKLLNGEFFLFQLKTFMASLSLFPKTNLSLCPQAA